MKTLAAEVTVDELEWKRVELRRLRDAQKEKVTKRFRLARANRRPGTFRPLPRQFALRLTARKSCKRTAKRFSRYSMCGTRFNNPKVPPSWRYRITNG